MQCQNHIKFKWTRSFRRKTKSGFCARVITFQTQSTGWELCFSQFVHRWRHCSYL